MLVLLRAVVGHHRRGWWEQSDRLTGIAKSAEESRRTLAQVGRGRQLPVMLMLRVDVAQAYVFQISRLLAPTPTKLRSLVKLH